VQIPVITYYFGTMAIPIFFSINGYLILGRKRLSYQYILTKVYHLLLPVFLWSLVGSVSQIYINHIFPNPIESAFLSLLQIGNFNVFWFIGALVIVQLCSPVLHWLMQHRWLLFQGCILFLGIACTAVMVTSYYLGYPVSKNIIQTFRLWTWLFYFMLGAWVRNIKLPVSIEKMRTLSKLNRILSFLVVVAFVQVLSVISATRLRTGFAEFDYDSLFVIVGVLIVMLLYSQVVSLGRSRLVTHLIHHVASNTMGIFIIHSIIIRVLIKFAPSMFRSFTPVLIIVVFVVSDVIVTVAKRIPLVRYFVSLD
ncbi:acyltransferase family protein, partial [Lacticaseibacillus paracasei]|uniref:acyltransferase family protein n=1 Tax=Lacticaseibacillus paracasei TaxID=1597 RepID=UPI002ADED610